MPGNNNKIFVDVLSQVRKGYAVENACKLLKISKESFYRALTPEQKHELREMKTTIRIYGCGVKLTRLDLQRTLINFNYQEDDEENI